MDRFSAKRSEQSGVTLRPESTAVLIVDMLRDFCDPAGAMPLGGAERLYPVQNGIVSAARTAGAMIGWFAQRQPVW